MLFPHRLTIVTGHYGTGKTEFSVNLALALAREHPDVTLADLDIVNPCFLSRERKALLAGSGVTLLPPPPARTAADVPSLPPQLLGLLDDPSRRGVLDIGGDPVGARVLARFRPRIAKEDHQLLFVLNANRPEVRQRDDAIRYLRSIEAVTGLSCTGIVNNTHLCGETTAEDIRKGAVLAASF